MIYFMNSYESIIEYIKKIEINQDKLGRYQIKKDAVSPLFNLYRNAVRRKKGKKGDALINAIASSYVATQNRPNIETADNIKNALAILKTANAQSNSTISNDAMAAYHAGQVEQLKQEQAKQTAAILEKLQQAEKIIISYFINEEFKEGGFSFKLIISGKNVQTIILPRSQQLRALISQLSPLLQGYEGKKILEDQIIALGNQTSSIEEFRQNFISAVNNQFHKNQEEKIAVHENNKLIESDKFILKPDGYYIPCKPDEKIDIVSKFKAESRKAIQEKQYDKIYSHYEDALNQQGLEATSNYLYILPKNRSMNSLQEDINELLAELQEEINHVEEKNANALTLAINDLFMVGAQVNKVISDFPLSWKKT